MQSVCVVMKAATSCLFIYLVFIIVMLWRRLHSMHTVVDAIKGKSYESECHQLLLSKRAQLVYYSFVMSKHRGRVITHIIRDVM